MARLEQVRLEHSYDIVSSLPIELLMQVVDYLDLTDIVRSQRVRVSSDSVQTRYHNQRLLGV